MSGCMTFGHEGKPLETFSALHLTVILIIIAVCVVFLFAWRRLESDNTKRLFRYIFAAFILLQQITIYIWYVYSGEWSIAVTLPLQLCDMSIALSVAAVLTKNRYITELLYFWGLGGATQAILTPDIGNFSFPHFVFYQFFISHCLILLASFYMISVEKFRPSFASVIRAFVITNIYAAIIYPINIITNGNYLFLRFKPPGGSLLDFLGPWPWYIPSLEGVAAGVFLLLYLPFAFSTAAKTTELSLHK